jgi:hypothetical protein
MFRKAYAIAKEFTRPVVLSRRTVAGKCSAGIGSYVVVNDQGWIVTAARIMQQFAELMEGDQKARSVEATVETINRDAALDPKERRKRLSSIPRLPKNGTDRGSAWWGWPGVQLKGFTAIPAADIAVGRLEPFDPSWTTTYPTFKDPSKDFEPGVSLCRLGFPLHNIQPLWDAPTSSFHLPPGSTPLPFFPIDGILTRFGQIEVDGGTPPPFPLLMIETSSPGLRGQSGGPIVDAQGTIWGIQSATIHYPLGFDPPVPGSTRGEKEHQFLNVGLGVHPETIFGLFRQAGVGFQVSAY